MIKKNQKKIKDSQNVLADTSIEAGKSVHIGNVINNHYPSTKENNTQNKNNTIQKKKAWKFLETTLFKIVLVSVTLIGLSISIEKCNFIEIRGANSNKLDSIKKITPDTTTIDINSKQLTTSEKEINKVNSKASKTPVVKLVFNNTEESIEQTASNALLVQAQRHNFNLLKTKAGLQFNEVFECEIRTKKEDVELGIRSVTKVTFHLDILHFKLSNQKHIVSFSQQSPAYFIYHEKEISTALDKWINALNGNLLFQQTQ